MKELVFPTDPAIKTEIAILAADASAGSSVTLTLENNDGLANTDYIVIGYEGSELCELAQINQAISGATAVRVATLKFNHQAGEPIVKYRYNQRKFYGATSQTGSYTHLSSYGSPKTMQVDDPQGTIFEYDGDEGYTYFKSTYVNSATSEESDIAEAEAVAGDQSGRYATLYAIRKHAGLSGNPRYSDYRLEQKRKQAENEIDSVLAAIYVLPLPEVPALITQICELLAAGSIDDEEFRTESPSAKEDSEGTGWMKQARKMLTDIQKGTRLLIGADRQELPRNAKVNRLSGYPDSGADDPTFSMSDKF
jgi:phage gp36-like protein